MAKAKDTNARVTRWFLALQDFSFQVQHRAGALHGNADGLSQQDMLWAHLPAAVGSELRGGYCRGGPTPDVQTRRFTPSPTAAPARGGQPRAGPNTNRKGCHGRVEPPTPRRRLIGEPGARCPPIQFQKEGIKGRPSARGRRKTDSATGLRPGRGRRQMRTVVTLENRHREPLLTSFFRESRRFPAPSPPGFPHPATHTHTRTHTPLLTEGQ
ncbi:hypothetical protein AMELA_G00070570 [Ameiurus melas]|uniref:Uncharacterized protein n=1 Tax=Ameiurus melas TaxID=219545 RepID=A0A7J6B5T7_AMEME|nr:hypothetical protein AMELA_G00070570 [Ameiurus melas]